MPTRPPIVAVLGHVDHGKTSLLDAIRSTNVAAKESGGITQHIGAYQVLHQERLLTFIDTPGHAAFTAMRARGGQVADIAVLVVAADDGVMPQTRESISHINQAGIPFVVALNKIDLPDSDPIKIKGQLAEAGVLVEGFGGNVPLVEVSAKNHLNLDLLLENILLLADLQELSADPQGLLEAIVIESSLSKNQGPLATVIVKNGTILPGDHLLTVGSLIPAKAKALKDWRGQNLNDAPPSSPAQILGFTLVPPVGSIITHKDSIDLLKDKLAPTSPTQLDHHHETAGLNLILKADVVGTLEAIISSLPEGLNLIHAGTGAINESDILLADTSDSLIIGFRVTPTPSAKKLAQIEKIRLNLFDTIYDLLDELKNLSHTDRLSKLEETILGEGSILKIFDLPAFRVFGTKVTSGTFKTNDKVHLKRQDGTTKNAVITSLKVGPKDVTKVSEGEFGAILNPPLDAKSGDILIAYTSPEDETVA